MALERVPSSDYMRPVSKGSLTARYMTHRWASWTHKTQVTDSRVPGEGRDKGQYVGRAGQDRSSEGCKDLPSKSCPGPGPVFISSS